MTKPQSEPRRLPIFKLLGIITLLIISTVYLVSWLSRSELLYAYDTVETKAVIVKSPVLDDPGQMFVALNYKACPSTTESIHLGKQTLDPKAPSAFVRLEHVSASWLWARRYRFKLPRGGNG